MHLLHRWMIVFMLAATVVVLPASPSVPVQAAPVPAGLAAEEWQQILNTFPVEQQVILRASNTQDYSSFGRNVAIEGNTLVVGSPYIKYYDGDTVTRGAAYVFVRNTEDGTWTEQAILRPAGYTDVIFATSVAISDGTIAIGSPGNQSDKGFIYIFKHSGTTWTQEAMFRPFAYQDDSLGAYIALDGNVLVVGAPRDGSSDSGAAYIFERNQQRIWEQKATLRISNAYAAFGSSLLVAGDTVIIGAPRQQHSGIMGFVGAAYIFVRDQSGGWVRQAVLQASNFEEANEFGRSFALHEDTLVIGAPGKRGGEGSAYIFLRTHTLSSTAWIEQAILQPSNSIPYDGFGSSVAINQDTILVGATWVGTPIANSAGGMYVFKHDSSITSESPWREQAMLYAMDGEYHDRFGLSMDLDANNLVIGTEYAEAVYVFKGFANQAPTAAAGIDRSVWTNATISLDTVASSDPDFDLLSYHWSQTGGTPVTITNPLSKSIGFLAPDDPSVLTITLTVSDTFGLTATDELVVTVNNQAPLGSAGVDQTVNVFETITLSATDMYDPDHDALSYEWRQRSGPPVIFTNPFSATTTFIAPTTPGVLSLRVIVTDAFGATATDGVLIAVTGQQIWLPMLQKVCGLTPGCR